MGSSGSVNIARQAGKGKPLFEHMFANRTAEIRGSYYSGQKNAAILPRRKNSGKFVEFCHQFFLEHLQSQRYNTAWRAKLY